MEPGTVSLPEQLAKRIGSLGGDDIVINGSSVALGDASDAWKGALPAALGI